MQDTNGEQKPSFRSYSRRQNLLVSHRLEPKVPYPIQRVGQFALPIVHLRIIGPCIHCRAGAILKPEGGGGVAHV